MDSCGTRWELIQNLASRSPERRSTVLPIAAELPPSSATNPSDSPPPPLPNNRTASNSKPPPMPPALGPVDVDANAAFASSPLRTSFSFCRLSDDTVSHSAHALCHPLSVNNPGTTSSGSVDWEGRKGAY
ncbi:hypothetical protein M427DRAFT_56401 [Gonapodya prolifera JEL478]|uniref:Uncharacterized protein n=1 Tax=Gonapodya prolifera (strain JEL478) TaxID=1344416 RepID=A0A139AGE8_GONPJ|nr:hypothetical protein M427DRAFT_56401 [Gonapodya prolifera JEL478]|eukprot:KXS15828.1 hypothetical protein M427DRAFT_56401 [Gonapodya prolifera JEL478]